MFVNDTSTTPAGEGRLVVRHTAAAPAVDVLAGGTAVISGLANPDEATLTLPAGTVSAAVAAAGTTDPVIGPADVPVVAGQVTIVYAIGSLEEQTLGVLVQTIEVGEVAAPAQEPHDHRPPRCPSPTPSPPAAAASPPRAARRSPSGSPLRSASLAMAGLVVSGRSLAGARTRS